ncbi:Rft protein-domain-containing protein [Gilbertella persicaria]|uniref:Rft protein-domain-containing protein n=1 Tax=Gilbertella persicaria TaxID=101096 RepID=UPI00221E7F9E|nr:Rft protein-domain-containing protein [Gilbertella persicaria]KAI8061552.1 Rft protein-domain-containing protein [Gilbertella persicaria]
MDTKPPSKPEEKKDDNLLATTVKGASYLIMLQFISRMLTFSLNQIVIRFTSKATFGIASVNLELLSSTILFISREGFRSVLIRKSKNQQSILNLAYIPSFFGLITTIAACLYYLSTISLEEQAQFPYYKTAVLLYGAASFLELLVEPLFILALNNLYFQLRVTIEEKSYWFDKALLHLGFTMTKQSFLKHVLTEGDKMLISILSSSQDRGVYAFVVNYGYWSLGEGNAPGVLAMYCIYVPFMGINGITEGFVQAVATKSDLTKLSYYMVLFSTCFMASGIVFMYVLELGAIGLILANMVNLGIRIAYSWFYICRYFDKVSLSVRQWLPHTTTVVSFMLAWTITYWSQNHLGWYTLSQKMAHISVGGVCFIIVCSVM